MTNNLCFTFRDLGSRAVAAVALTAALLWAPSVWADAAKPAGAGSFLNSDSFGVQGLGSGYYEGGKDLFSGSSGLSGGKSFLPSGGFTGDAGGSHDFRGIGSGIDPFRSQSGSSSGRDLYRMQSGGSSADSATIEALKALRSGSASPTDESNLNPNRPARPSQAGPQGDTLTNIMKDAAKDVTQNVLDPAMNNDGSVSVSVFGLGRVNLKKSEDSGASSATTTVDNQGDIYQASSTSDPSTEGAAFGNKSNPNALRGSSKGVFGYAKDILSSWIFYVAVGTIGLLLMVVQRVSLR